MDLEAHARKLNAGKSAAAGIAGQAQDAVEKCAVEYAAVMARNNVPLASLGFNVRTRAKRRFRDPVWETRWAERGKAWAVPADSPFMLRRSDGSTNPDVAVLKSGTAVWCLNSRPSSPTLEIFTGEGYFHEFAVGSKELCPLNVGLGHAWRRLQWTSLTEGAFHGVYPGQTGTDAEALTAWRTYVEWYFASAVAAMLS